MFESPEFDLIIENNDEILYAEINESINFSVAIQNISHRFISDVSLELLTPPQIRNLTQRHRPISMSSGKKKKFSFKIKPLNNGIFILTGLIKEKYIQRAKLPIIIRVGKKSLSMDLPNIIYDNPKSSYHTPGAILKAEQDEKIKKQEKEKKKERKQDLSLNCPFCNYKINSDSSFCSRCGADLTKEKNEDPKFDLKNYCSECGNELPNGAEFCAQCGKKID